MSDTQDPQRVERLVKKLLQARDMDPCSEGSRRADSTTIEALVEAGVHHLRCSDLLWTEDPNVSGEGSCDLFVHYKYKTADRCLLFQVEKQELVRLAKSVLYYLGEPIHNVILEELRQLRRDLKQQQSSPPPGNL